MVKRVEENKMEMNAMRGQGKHIREQKEGSRGLSWVRPQMMQQVLSSIALPHDKSAAHSPNQMELLKLFPESRTPSEKETISSSSSPFANDIRSVSGSSSEGQSTAQLTIFYNGEVKVYSVSADKAQAVMKLADSKCLIERTTLKPSHGENGEWREVTAGLGIARKLCLQRFLQRRKGRLGSVAPYAAGGYKTNSKGWGEENGDDYQQISLSLSFPSQRCG